MLETREILKQFGPGLSAQDLEEAQRAAESMRTVRFLFHTWFPINNRDVSGNRFNSRHASLARMALIPVWAWDVPVLVPRSQPFAVGVVTAAGVTPAASVGSNHTKRTQLPAESVRMFLDAYAQYGMVELKSLASETDEAKLEAFLLFEAVMKTQPDDQTAPVGVDCLMEHFPKWLYSVAPRMLEKAFKEGVMYGEGEAAQKFTLKRSARERGRRMIAEMKESIIAANHKAVNETNGVLSETKKQVLAAQAGQKGNKILLDGLDTWLSQQHPNFSFDTAVERAQRANREITDALRESSSDNSSAMQQLLEQNARLIAALEKRLTS